MNLADFLRTWGPLIGLGLFALIDAIRSRARVTGYREGYEIGKAEGWGDAVDSLRAQAAAQGFVVRVLVRDEEDDADAKVLN